MTTKAKNKRPIKKRSKGKQKGSAFERKVCKQLSLWVSGKEREDLFWRSAMSGGRATVGRRSGKDHAHHAGDISSTSPEGHALTDKWYVECKFYRDLQIKSALIEGIGKLTKFWRTACSEATAHGKLPMLIAKQNNTKVLLLTPLAAHMDPSGLEPLRHSTLLARSWTLRADIFCFESVMSTEFAKVREVNERFLGPGELQRILTGKRVTTRAKILKRKKR